jgi:hypothetical protein
VAVPEAFAAGQGERLVTDRDGQVIDRLADCDDVQD